MVSKQIKIESVQDIISGIDENRLGGDEGIRNFLFSNAKGASHISIDTEGLLNIEMAITRNGGSSTTFNKFKKAIRDFRRDARVQDDWISPYSSENGRMFFSDPNTVGSAPISDFTATITKVIQPEYGDNLYTIEGETSHGRYFETEISATDFEDERKLRSVLGSAAGENASIYWRMGSHLPPAIKSLSGQEEVKTVFLYQRTGWANGRFLIRGREPEGVKLELTPETDYNLSGEGDLVNGLEALNRLIMSVGAKYTLPIIASIFAPTIRRFMPRGQQRFQTFVVGETNSFKTSVCMAAMQIFMTESSNNFLKFGEGATKKGMMITCTYAGDLPLLIDNYRPDGKFAASNLQGLIHLVTEGGSRVLANQDGVTVKRSKPISCQLIMTGEDFPLGSESAMTRTVLVQFPAWEGVGRNEDLLYAQLNGSDLSMVGSVWLDWIESTEGQSKIKEIVEKYEEIAQDWSNILEGVKALEGRSIPVPRIADNLSYLAIVVECLKECPNIKDIIGEYEDILIKESLFDIARNLASGTGQSNEGSRFIDGVKSMLDSGRAIMALSQDDNINAMSDDDRRRCIGWIMTGTGDYGIIPNVAIALLRKEHNEDLGGISKPGLGRKLNGLEALIKGKNGYTVQRRCGDKRPSLFLIKKEFFESDED